MSSYLDKINNVVSGKGTGKICDLVKARHEREAAEKELETKIRKISEKCKSFLREKLFSDLTDQQFESAYKLLDSFLLDQLKDLDLSVIPDEGIDKIVGGIISKLDNPKTEEPEHPKSHLPIVDVFTSIFGNKKGEAIYNAIPEFELSLEMERFVRNLASNLYYIDSCSESSLKRFKEEDCEKKNIEEIRDVLAETSSWSFDGTRLAAIVKLLYTAKFNPDMISEFSKILCKGIKESQKTQNPVQAQGAKPKKETPKVETSGPLHEMCKDTKVKANLVTLLFMLEFDDDSRLSNVRKMDIAKLSEANRIFLQRLTDVTSSYSDSQDTEEDEDFNSCGPVWVFSNMLKSSGSLLDIDKFAGYTIRKLSDMGYTFSEIIDHLRSIFPVINGVAFEIPESPEAEEEQPQEKQEQEENPDTEKTEESEQEITEICMNDIDTLYKVLGSLIPISFSLNRVNDIEFTLTSLESRNVFRLVMIENDPCILAVGTIDGQDITIPVSIGYDGIVRNMLIESRYVLTQEEIETLQKEGIDPRIMAFLDVEGSASIEGSATEEETLQFNRVLLNIGFKLSSMFGKVPMLRIKSFDSMTKFVMVSNGAGIRHPEFNTGIEMSGVNVSVDGNKVRISYKGKATKFELK